MNAAGNIIESATVKSTRGVTVACRSRQREGGSARGGLRWMTKGNQAGMKWLPTALAAMQLLQTAAGPSAQTQARKLRPGLDVGPSSHQPQNQPQVLLKIPSTADFALLALRSGLIPLAALFAQKPTQCTAPSRGVVFTATCKST